MQLPVMRKSISLSQKMKNNKPPGEDGICCDCLNKGRLNIISSIWFTATFSEVWKTALIPTHKKGDQLNWQKYRGPAVSEKL